MPKPSVVAVVDIGSNSIKSLVAARDDCGGIVAQLAQAIDARISAGIGQARPRLSEDGMQQGLAAIRELLDGIAAFAPEQTVLVATSAVRDAANGAEFARRIKTATGHGLRILSGEEEASLIGRGLTSDQRLADLQSFDVFDLGGGSLECLAFRDRRIEQAISLPLGCVRLTERCVDNPDLPFTAQSRAEIGAVCREAFAAGGFRFSPTPGSGAVFTGGTITTVREILAARSGVAFSATSPVISVEALRTLLDEVAVLPLAARRQVAGLPAARADVFPTALTTALAVAEIGGFTSFRNSLHNLRYGLAAELLDVRASTM
jgi:exopolyphosphatase/guanosine-5'-triphosphate,3'-diphosphate pyrophosphatase